MECRTMSDTVETWRTKSVSEGSTLSPLAGERDDPRQVPVKCRPGPQAAKPFVGGAEGHAPTPVSPAKRRTWGQTEGTPLPLGATWIEEERAFNFAVHAEHADSVTLLLYSMNDFANPVLTFPFKFLGNKSGRIWHCRLPLSEMRGARYYAYSVSGQAVSEIERFYPEKVLLDPYAKCVFFPPEFDRKQAMVDGPNPGKAPLGVLTDHRIPLVRRRFPSARIGRHHLRTSCQGLYKKSKFRCASLTCWHVLRPGGKDSLLEGTRHNGRRTDACISARSSGGRLLGLHAFELLRTPCAVCLRLCGR